MIDFFKKPMPAFNMRGRNTVPSIAGGVMSIGLSMVLLTYSTVKLQHLLTRHNPNISSFLESGVLDSDTKFNFRDNGVKFAFGIEGFIDKQLKDDPRYVKVITRLYGHMNGELYEKFIPVHYCTEEELDAFPAPTSESEGLINTFKSKSDRNIYCIDWDKYGDDMAIWSTEDDEISYQRFEYTLVPCNYIHSEVGTTNDFVSEECIADRDK